MLSRWYELDSYKEPSLYARAHVPSSETLLQHRSQLRLGAGGLVQRTTRPQRATVNLNGLAVDVAAGAAGQVDHDTCDNPRPGEAAPGGGLGVLVEAAADLEQARSHLCREPAGADRVDQDVPGTQLDGQVATQVQHGGLGRAVAIRGLVSE